MSPTQQTPRDALAALEKAWANTPGYLANLGPWQSMVPLLLLLLRQLLDRVTVLENAVDAAMAPPDLLDDEEDDAPWNQNR